MASITSANSVLLLAISGLYTTPQQIQGFTADDISDFASISPAEVSMGLDGRLSAGYVPVAIVQSITLQADSPSIMLFEAWFAAQQAARDVYFANGIVQYPAVSRSYVMTAGVLTGYAPLSDAKKMLQPRKFSITWQTIVGAPL